MIPEILCVGFPKCGTTTLYDILIQYPEINMTEFIKEPLYYKFPDLYKKGFEWYQNVYYGHLDKNSKNIIEINPTLWNQADKLRKDFKQDIKLIFIMRNPVDVLYSRYKYMGMYGDLDERNMQSYLQGPHNLTFHQYAKRAIIERNEWVQRGNYFTSISSYLKYFPIENMYFMFFEEFIKDQQIECNKLMDFLGIHYSESTKINYNIKSNASNKIPKNIAAANIMHQFTLLDNFLGYRGGLIKFKKTYKSLTNVKNFIFNICWRDDKDLNFMDLETKKMIEKYYRDEVKCLGKLLNRDLSRMWF